MSITNLPNGLTVQGVPVLGGVGIPVTTGKYFFVSSTTAGGRGTKKSPFATIDEAVGNCQANRGDVIVVMPGHNESITAATSLVVDVAGVQIVGIGIGANRPVLDFDNTAGSIEMDAANCRLSNMVLNASVSAVVVAINVDADRVELDNLTTTFEATGDDFLTIIDVDAVDYTNIHDCVFHSELGATGGTQGIRLDDTKYTAIRDCRFVGNWTAAAIIGAGALSEGLVMENIHLYNEDTSVYNGIDMGTLSTTGWARNITMTALYATTKDKCYRDGDLASFNVRAVNAVSESAGHLLPATTAT